MPIGYYADLSLLNLTELTTPIAYMSSVGFTDPFQPIAKFQSGGSNGNSLKSYLYFNLGPSGNPNRMTWADRALTGGNAKFKKAKSFLLDSNGPDRTQGALEWGACGVWTMAKTTDAIYDPSNGTTSLGDIYSFSAQPA